jgi:hypothetical protein
MVAGGADDFGANAAGIHLEGLVTMRAFKYKIHSKSAKQRLKSRLRPARGKLQRKGSRPLEEGASQFIWGFVCGWRPVGRQEEIAFPGEAAQSGGWNISI